MESPRTAAFHKKMPAKTGGLSLSKNQRFFDRKGLVCSRRAPQKRHLPSRKVHTERHMSALYAFLLDCLFAILFRQIQIDCQNRRFELSVQHTFFSEIKRQAFIFAASFPADAYIVESPFLE